MNRVFFCHIVSLVTIVSCASHAPLSPDAQSIVGSSVGIGVRPGVVQPQVDTPFMHYRSGPGVTDRLAGAGNQAFQGMRSGASLGAIWLSGGCYASGCLGGLVLALATAATGATVGSVTGAVSGALSGAPQLTPEVGAAVQELGIPQALRDQIHHALKDLPTPHFSKISYPADYTPSHPAPLYEFLLTSGTETFLELTLSSMRFIGTANDGPHEVSITVNSRLFRVKDFAVIDARSWEYRSDGHTFVEWEADNGHLLGEKLETFYVDIAEKVKKELFSTFVDRVSSP